MTLALFDDETMIGPEVVRLGPRAFVFRNRVTHVAGELLDHIRHIESLARFRHMETPGGFTMSVGLTNAGRFGWTSDVSGYRYTERDPLTGQAWPPLPELFRKLSRQAAEDAGFSGFEPDACLINRYVPGARLSLHQDKNEKDFESPIVSVSLGIDAQFLFGGLRRADKVTRIPLHHGDVAVWGGPDRLRYHGVSPLKLGLHPLTGEVRFNLTLRKAK